MPRLDRSRKVAFTASVSSSSSSWSTSTLVFPVVITNLGHGYNPNDGVFPASTAGVYVFFVNVQSYNPLSVYVDIVVNGARKVRTMASNHYDAGPNLAVLTLLKLDRVWVKRYSGQGYYSNGPMTTFSGFLIG
uniref:C1q domain-containing protein n=1 Tax=Magallana gigas TaxID=29159 RepID=A0A8W8J9Z2_MAGGI